MMGAKLILDIHDIVPEFFASKFKTSPKSPYIRALKTIEKISAAFVDHVIISNDLWMKTLTSRSAPREKCSVFVNQVDPAIFYPRKRSRNDGNFIVIFPGTFQWHQGLDIAIDAFARVRQKMPNAEFHLYGDGGSTEGSLREQARRLGIADAVVFKGCVPLDRIPEVIANADLGVVPKRANSFGDEAYSTKIMEFMSQRIPVVCSRTKIDTFYFDEGTVRFFPSGDSEALAEAMIDVLNHKSLRDHMIARGTEYVCQHNWSMNRNKYFSLVDTLINDGFGLKSTFGDGALEFGSTTKTSSGQ
jgi:glycosyltransferase involved in cell wall biosynthesis